MLTNRKLQILQVIIDDFIATAQPVGSRQIAKKEGMTFSAATIRNEMADLEELGFLEKTHTSSGRVPSEKGYRFYVDHLLKPQVITTQDIKTIQSLFQDRMMETEQVIRKSADILSDLTTYTSIILGPDVQLHRVRQFSIVPLTADSAVAIIVTDNGHVENRLISIPKSFSPSDIEKVVNILNERLVGVPLEQLQNKLEQEAAAVIKSHLGTYDGLLSSIFDINKYQGEGKIYYGGKTNMLNQPEFHDLNKVRMLMELMEKTSQIQTIFPLHETGIHIRIGSENHHLAMEDCSVITASYSVGEELKGSIAIIGPTRMDYKRVVSILDFMSNGLSYQFTKRIQ
ncbi:heat-inducible transcriptional repressor HrcA [Rummeliibacillus pycnus]|uniref:heat-inducible transcriptional repressor HrcA n=1 Tax=Rummeliibacillus pycnus TaxID=101070 RepID=UPI0037C55D20